MSPLFLGCSSLAVAILAISGVTPPSGRNQQDRSVATSATRIVSPSVLATWIAKRDDRGRPQLDLLVLWRGLSGWCARRPAGERTSGGGPGTSSITPIRGDLQLQLSFDIKKRIASVGGTDVPLDKNNVILVDDVDGVAARSATEHTRAADESPRNCLQRGTLSNPGLANL